MASCVLRISAFSLAGTTTSFLDTVTAARVAKWKPTSLKTSRMRATLLAP